MAAHRVSAAEERRRQRVYRETDSDTAAGKILGIRSESFGAWRERRRLPPRSRPGRELDARQVAERTRVIQSCSSLAEAAQRLGLTPPAVFMFLKAHGLPNPFREAIDARHAQWVQQMRAGATNAAIASEAGVSEGTVRRVREVAGLPPNPRGRKPKA